MNQQVARLRGLIEQIARPLATLDDEVERALVDLACAVARRLLDEELTLAPERVLTLARTALAALPADLRDIRLYLPPDDAKIGRASCRGRMCQYGSHSGGPGPLKKKKKK